MLMGKLHSISSSMVSVLVFYTHCRFLELILKTPSVCNHFCLKVFFTHPTVGPKSQQVPGSAFLILKPLGYFFDSHSFM